jgi:hypothetical protein
MDAEEPRGPVDPSALPLAIETMLGYTGSVGTALWYEIGRDRGKVGCKHPRIVPFLTFFFRRRFCWIRKWIVCWKARRPSGLTSTFWRIGLWMLRCPPRVLIREPLQ